MRTLILIPVFTCFLSTAVAAQDRQGLEFEAGIENSLLIVMTADLIRKNCDSISARKLKAILYIKGVQRRARALGYSKAEIEHHVDDEGQKARLERISLAYLASKGLDADVPSTFCTVGRAEMAGDSTVGSLLTGG